MECWKVSFVAICALVISCSFIRAARAAGTTGDKLIVVLVDGCRWNYIDDPRLESKGFRRLIENGVRAPYVVPAYPSLSYVNWYSIVTGLHPESHGFVNNIMFDNATGQTFLMFPNDGSTDPHWWNQAEPVWATAEKQGKPAAMYWWEGCEIEIRGSRPMICERHRYGPGTPEETLDFLERVDDVLQLFKPPRQDRLSLALMYYGSVDHNGHEFGPGSPETLRSLKDIDDILYRMQHKIARAGLQDEVNLMVVSDHGMTDTRPSLVTFVDLEKFSPSIRYQVTAGAQTSLVPEDGMLDKLYDDLKAAKIKGIKVFKKEEIPDSYHLKNSPLVNDIFVEAEKGFLIKPLADSNKVIGYKNADKGTHGYHPDEVHDMRTIFLAAGPAFRKGYTLPPVRNVDLYNVMCDVLRITPLPNNGSATVLEEVKAKRAPSSLSSAASRASSSLVLPVVTLLFCLVSKVFRL